LVFSIRCTVEFNTEDEHRRLQVLHKQVVELVYKVFSYIKREADIGVRVREVAIEQNVLMRVL
jgi:hypothetical protein